MNGNVEGLISIALKSQARLMFCKHSSVESTRSTVCAQSPSVCVCVALKSVVDLGVASCLSDFRTAKINGIASPCWSLIRNNSCFHSLIQSRAYRALEKKTE